MTLTTTFTITFFISGSQTVPSLSSLWSEFQNPHTEEQAWWWFYGNNGLCFVHLAINSLRPQHHRIKFHSDKARGWTLLNKSFCLALVDFWYCRFSVWDWWCCQEGVLSGTDGWYGAKVARKGLQPHYCSVLCTEFLLLIFPTWTSIPKSTGLSPSYLIPSQKKKHLKKVHLVKFEIAWILTL